MEEDEEEVVLLLVLEAELEVDQVPQVAASVLEVEEDLEEEEEVVVVEVDHPAQLASVDDGAWAYGEAVTAPTMAAAAT